MRGVFWGLGLVIGLFGGADAACANFGGTYRQILIFEDGTFRVGSNSIVSETDILTLI